MNKKDRITKELRKFLRASIGDPIKALGMIFEAKQKAVEEGDYEMAGWLLLTERLIARAFELSKESENSSSNGGNNGVGYIS